MKQTFVNQDKEYSVYRLPTQSKPVFQQATKYIKKKPELSDSWQVTLLSPSTFPIKTGLGLKETKDDFVILSSDIGPHKA